MFWVVFGLGSDLRVKRARPLVTFLLYNPSKALFYAAQGPKPYEVTKFLLEKKCSLFQENAANLQPIHALVSNQKASAKEIVETINLYRVNGHEVAVSAYPVHKIMDFPLRNYLFGFGPETYLERNSALSETEVVSIKAEFEFELIMIYDVAFAPGVGNYFGLFSSSQKVSHDQPDGGRFRQSAYQIVQ